GRPLDEVTVDAVIAGEVTADELRISPDALHRQALVAAASGRPALVANFERAAELTGIPDDRLLEIYEALRPRRSTGAQLEAIAVDFETRYSAPLNAAFVREAADAYLQRNLLLTEPG
ncbi:MAG TPA: diol dehydratase small subunit, partial [Thermomicrobiales bacterium]|nr:diol dehydratase small subunit [Thermomicrobiales bacterium]